MRLIAPNEADGSGVDPGPRNETQPQPAPRPCEAVSSPPTTA